MNVRDEYPIIFCSRHFIETISIACFSTFFFFAYPLLFYNVVGRYFFRHNMSDQIGFSIFNLSLKMHYLIAVKNLSRKACKFILGDFAIFLPQARMCEIDSCCVQMFCCAEANKPLEVFSLFVVVHTEIDILITCRCASR